MRVGDQITFYRPRVTDERGIVYPSSDIGVAQILRVTQYASTALIIDQVYPGISEGTLARVSAKLP